MELSWRHLIAWRVRRRVAMWAAHRSRRRRHGPRHFRVLVEAGRHAAFLRAAAGIGTCTVVCSWETWFFLTTACRRTRGFKSPSVFAMTALSEDLVEVPMEGPVLAAMMDGLRATATRARTALCDRIRAGHLYRAVAAALPTATISRAAAPTFTLPVVVPAARTRPRVCARVERSRGR